ncbi:hypothetical protein [Caproiciproducens sp. LBM24188]|nr:hypothetical protein [Oscillospiraceae bacterium]HHV31898.1 hypothetical protein [Clostridiales bacterium]
MDYTEKSKTAEQALDSARLAYCRLNELELERKEIQSLTAAMAAVNEKVDHLKSDVIEIKKDIKEITLRPMRIWDRLIAAVIGAAATGLVTAVFQLILR